MLTIILGLSICVCLGMFCFWCCRLKLSDDDDESSEEEKGIEMAPRVDNVVPANTQYNQQNNSVNKNPVKNLSTA